MEYDEKHSKWRRHCLTLTAAVIFLALLLSILGATVFRPKNPVITVIAVAIRNLDVSFDALRVNIHLNISLDADLTVYNPNRVGLKYTDSSAIMLYRGQVVGQAPIPAGQINSGQTLPMHLTLTVMGDRLLSNSQQLIADVVSGTLPLTTQTKISGKVTVLVFKIRVVSYAVCDMNISIASKSLLNNVCRYDTHVL